MSSEVFFRKKKAAAVLKHGILSRYIVPFAAKTGSTSKDRRVVVLDGYAGEGRYEDGSPGSPIYMVEAARKVPAGRKVELIFVEKDEDRFDKLNTVLEAEAADVTYKTLPGDVDRHFDAILAQASGVPLFAFLDPCGLGMNFADIAEKIFQRPWPTEVLLNFSADAVRRIGGLLATPEGSKGREATLRHMDEVCGGDWWQKMYVEAGNPERAAKLIAGEYRNRLCLTAKAGGWVIEVKNADNQQPKYSLVFITRHRDGLTIFGDQVSRAQEEWRRAIIEPYSEMDSDVAFKTEEEVLARGWVQHMKQNLERLLSVQDGFTIRGKYGEIFDEATGLARQMHLRRAINQLHSEGTVMEKAAPGDKIWDQVIRRSKSA